MPFSNWLCTNSTKNMLVKIVHPGGHVELHDRPVLASEIMLRNPKCIVAHPHVFQQPWAIVAPDTTLTLGQKYYVVPVSTIRKLRRLSFKYSPSPIEENGSSEACKDDQRKDDNINSTCWFFKNENTLNCMKHSGDEGERVNMSGTDPRSNVSEDKCFMRLLARMKIKGNGDDSSEGPRSSSSSVSSETKRLTRKRSNDFAKRSPRRSVTIDHWQPNLEIITEEQSN